MVLAIATGVGLAIGLTIWLARVPSSEPKARGADTHCLLEALERGGVLRGLADDAGLDRAIAELEGTVLPAAFHPTPSSPVVPTKSAERRP